MNTALCLVKQEISAFVYADRVERYTTESGVFSIPCEILFSSEAGSRNTMKQSQDRFEKIERLEEGIYIIAHKSRDPTTRQVSLTILLI